MKRREFLALLGSAALWPHAARAQRGERMRLVGVLPGTGSQSDAEGQARIAQFRQAMHQLGWIEGRNVRYEYRLRAGTSVDLVRQYAAELAALGPDVILVGALRIWRRCNG